MYANKEKLVEELHEPIIKKIKKNTLFRIPTQSLGC